MCAPRSPPRPTRARPAARTPPGSTTAVARPTRWPTRRRRGRSVQHDELEAHRAVAHLGQAHRVARLTTAVRRAAGVEELQAVRPRLVQRDVRMAEDHGAGTGEAGPHAGHAPRRL